MSASWRNEKRLKRTPSFYEKSDSKLESESDLEPGFHHQHGSLGSNFSDSSDSQKEIDYPSKPPSSCDEYDKIFKKKKRPSNQQIRRLNEQKELRRLMKLLESLPSSSCHSTHTTEKLIEDSEETRKDGSVVRKRSITERSTYVWNQHTGYEGDAESSQKK